MENNINKAPMTLSILEKRKSCREYINQQITEQELEVLLQAGAAAPISMNAVEEVKIFVIQNKTLLDKLEEMTQAFFSSMGVTGKKTLYDAPTLILVAVKKKQGPLRTSLFSSAACILENMIMAATEMELGNVYVAGVTVALALNPELSKEVGIPEDFEAASALLVGYTNQKVEKRNLKESRIAVERR